MKTIYFDCIAGASGDMILGALLDAGFPHSALLQGLSGLGLDNFDLQIKKIDKNGIQATKVDVLVSDDAPARRLRELVAIVSDSALTPAVKAQANSMFRRLGEEEAHIHGMSIDEVHLHELGGVDTIVDIVGALIGLEALGIEQVVASPLPLGRGFVNSAHGKLPLPAPATVALLKGVPIVGSDLALELVTPTGALLLSSLASRFGSIPTMTLSEIGYGAGGRDLPIPNVLRVLIGHQAGSDGVTTETLVMVETNIDDLSPEIYEYVMARLFQAGALDVTLAPIQMKKNRPGTLLSVLCRPAGVDSLVDILFAETSTLGIRRHFVSRVALPRSIQTVETPYGPVRVKVAMRGSRWLKASPEYEDCRRLAEAHGVALRQVYQAAERAVAEALRDHV